MPNNNNVNRTSELDFLEYLSINNNREVIVNEKSDSKMISVAWKNPFSTPL